VLALPLAEAREHRLALDGGVLGAVVAVQRLQRGHRRGGADRVAAEGAAVVAGHEGAELRLRQAGGDGQAAPQGLRDGRHVWPVAESAPKVRPWKEPSDVMMVCRPGPRWLWDHLRASLSAVSVASAPELQKNALRPPARAASICPRRAPHGW